MYFTASLPTIPIFLTYLLLQRAYQLQQKLYEQLRKHSSPPNKEESDRLMYYYFPGSFVALMALLVHMS
jgi:hypothetical protein